MTKVITLVINVDCVIFRSVLVGVIRILAQFDNPPIRHSMVWIISAVVKANGIGPQ
jgi:hypothetical protein